MTTKMLMFTWLCKHSIRMGGTLSLHFGNKATWQWFIRRYPSLQLIYSQRQPYWSQQLLLSETDPLLQQLYKEFKDTVFLVLGCSDKSLCRVKRQESSLTQETGSIGSYWLPLEVKDPPVSFWTRNLTSGEGHVEEMAEEGKSTCAWLSTSRFTKWRLKF